MEETLESKRGFANAIRRFRRMANRKSNIIDMSTKKKRLISGLETSGDEVSVASNSSLSAMNKRPCKIGFSASLSSGFNNEQTNSANCDGHIYEAQVVHDLCPEVPSPTDSCCSEPPGPTSRIPSPNFFAPANMSSIPLSGSFAGLSYPQGANFSSTPNWPSHSSAGAFPAGCSPPNNPAGAAFLQGVAWAAALLGPAGAAALLGAQASPPPSWPGHCRPARASQAPLWQPWRRGQGRRRPLPPGPPCWTRKRRPALSGPHGRTWAPEPVARAARHEPRCGLSLPAGGRAKGVSTGRGGARLCRALPPSHPRCPVPHPSCLRRRRARARSRRGPQSERSVAAGG